MLHKNAPNPTTNMQKKNEIIGNASATFPNKNSPGMMPKNTVLLKKTISNVLEVPYKYSNTNNIIPVKMLL